MRIHHLFPASLALCLLCIVASPGIANSQLLCPPTDDVVIEGSCPTECYEDAMCQRETGLNTSLCCRSPSCGQQCAAGLTAPHHSPVQLCPELDPDTVGLCAELCSGDSDCSGENQLCCSNGCGHSCSAAAPVCESILRSRNGTFRTGEYVPECSEDGRFAPAQCHGSTGYCWCVRPETGEPVGRSMVRFSQPECNSCSYNGQVYYPGDRFMDDCNTCYCYEDGIVLCSEIACRDCYGDDGENIYYDGQVVEYFGRCSKRRCVNGEIVLIDYCESCVDNGVTYQDGETLEDCACVCLDGAVACALLDGPCGGAPTDPLRGDLEWWHAVLIGAGTLLVVVALIAITLVVGIVILVRRNRLRHKKLPRVSQVSFSLPLFKNGLPEAESVELKVPVEDEEEPVKT